METATKTPLRFNVDQSTGLGVEILELPAPEPFLLEATFESHGPYIPIATDAITTILARVRQGGEEYAWVRNIETHAEVQCAGDSARGLFLEAMDADGWWRRFVAPGGSTAIRYVRAKRGFVHRAPQRECLMLATATAAAALWCLDQRVLEGLVLAEAALWEEEMRAHVRRA